MVVGDTKELCLDIGGVELAVLFFEEFVLAGLEILLLPGRLVPDDGFDPGGGVGNSGLFDDISFSFKSLLPLLIPFKGGADIVKFLNQTLPVRTSPCWLQ